MSAIRNAVGAEPAAPTGVLGPLVLVVVMPVAVSLATVVRLAPGEITVRPWFDSFRRVTVPVSRGVYAETADGPAGSSRVLVMRSDGGAWVCLADDVWDEDDLKVIADHAGVELVRQPMGTEELARRAPGALDRRPWTRWRAVNVVLAVALAGLGLWLLTDFDAWVGGWP